MSEAPVCPKEVRLAKPDDEPALMGLLELRHKEDGLGRFDPAMAALSVRRGLMRDFGYIGVIRGARAIEASIGLFVTTPWDSSDPLLVDSWNFVDPAHRKSSHAKSLLCFGKWAAHQLGLPLLMSKLRNDQTAGMARLYARQLPEAGALFLYDPKASPIAA